MEGPQFFFFSRTWGPWKVKRRVGGFFFNKKGKLSFAIFWYSRSVKMLLNFFKRPKGVLGKHECCQVGVCKFICIKHPEFRNYSPQLELIARVQFPLSSNPISQSVLCVLTLLLCEISSLGLGLFVSPLEPLLLVRFREGMGGLVSTGLKEILWRVNTFDECIDWPVPTRSAEDTRKRWLAESVSGEIEGWFDGVKSMDDTWLLKAVPLDLEKKKRERVF